MKFCNVGSERGYHYLGSSRIYYPMGKAFAEGMKSLLEGTDEPAASAPG